MKSDWKMLAGFYLAAFAVQCAGNYFTMGSVASWYPTLTKSELTPPGYWFGIVWTTLYILMSIAAWRVWCIQRNGLFTKELKLWWLQLGLGLLWSATFFGMRDPELGFAVILAVLAAVFATIARFLCIERMAGYMLVPLGLWVSFATYLNAFITFHN